MEQSIKITTKQEQESDRKYWMSRSPEERLAALETLRQQYVRLKGLPTRLQRVCRVVKKEQG
ncbi:MAG TPA: hypothetical protein VFM80_05100 [Gracilimonas sp.]|nr:hypothetical protein [Gracilimonas sp.]